MEKSVIDPSILKKGDMIHYYSTNSDGFCTEIGTIKDDNFHKEGVDVVGEGWKQYVGKWFIFKVEREGKIIFQN